MFVEVSIPSTHWAHITVKCVRRKKSIHKGEFSNLTFYNSKHVQKLLTEFRI